MTARNDITGDSIVNKKGDRKKYAEGWDRIYGNKSGEDKKSDSKDKKQKQK